MSNRKKLHSNTHKAHVIWHHPLKALKSVPQWEILFLKPLSLYCCIVAAAWVTLATAEATLPQDRRLHEASGKQRLNAIRKGVLKIIDLSAHVTRTT